MCEEADKIVLDVGWTYPLFLIFQGQQLNCEVRWGRKAPPLMILAYDHDEVELMEVKV